MTAYLDDKHPDMKRARDLMSRAPEGYYVALPALTGSEEISLNEAPVLHDTAEHAEADISAHAVLPVHLTADTALLRTVLQDNIDGPNFTELRTRRIEEIARDGSLNLLNLRFGETNGTRARDRHHLHTSCDSQSDCSNQNFPHLYPLGFTKKPNGRADFRRSKPSIRIAMSSSLGRTRSAETATVAEQSN